MIDVYKSRTGITETVLENDNKQVKYCTGLPSYEQSVKGMIVFDFVAKDFTRR